MKRVGMWSTCLLILAVISVIPGWGVLAEASPWRELITNFNTVLEPGAWQGWALNPAETCGAYLVEVSPHGAGREGDVVERAVVQAEFDGSQWNDVLRAMIPESQPRLKVNLRVYRTCSLPVVMEFEETLEAGAWMGWVVGPARLERGYLVEVTPLEPSVDGAYVWKSIVQQEFFEGDWQDVLRLQTPAEFPDLKVHVRVYAVERAPMVYQFTTTLQPGEPTRYGLGPSSEIGWYVIEINPLEKPEAGEFVEQVAIQPFYKGGWENTLVLKAVEDQPAIEVQVRIYAFGSAKGLSTIERP